MKRNQYLYQCYYAMVHVLLLAEPVVPQPWKKKSKFP
jgi:hypothetical protein